jgi:hypothetical protein
MKYNKNKVDAVHELKNILVITLGFTILFLIFNSPYLIYTSVIIGVLGLSSVFVRNRIVFIWEKIASILGKINSWIILSLIFYIILFPIAMIAKLFNMKFLQIKKPKETVYFLRNHKYTAVDIENPW